MNVDIRLVGTIVSVVLAVAGFFIGRMTAAKTDGKQDGVILTEIGYIKSGVDDLKSQMRDNDRRYTDMYARVSLIEASEKETRKRLDEHLGVRGRSE